MDRGILKSNQEEVMTMALLCLWFLENHSVSHAQEVHEFVENFSSKLFEAVKCSHLMYDKKDVHQETPTIVISLQQKLLDMFPSLCKHASVEDILRSYQGTMSTSDQNLLQTLERLENNGRMGSLVPIAFGHHVTEVFKGSDFVEPKPYFIIRQFYLSKLVHTCLNYNREMNHKTSIIQSPDASIFDPRFLLPCFVFAAGGYVKSVPTSDSKKAENMKNRPASDPALQRLLLVAVTFLGAKDITLRAQAVRILQLVRATQVRLRFDANTCLVYVFFFLAFLEISLIVAVSSCLEKKINLCLF